MGLISSLLKASLIAGAGITAYQASEKTKKETGKVKRKAFLKNFKELAAKNAKLVIDSVKSSLGLEQGGYRYSDSGENGYSYSAPKAEAEEAPKADAENTPKSEAENTGDKVNEVFETMKEKAPEVIGKVQDFVEDVREHAPEYKEKAQAFVEGVKDAAKKAFDDSDKKDE